MADDPEAVVESSDSGVESGSEDSGAPAEEQDDFYWDQSKYKVRVRLVGGRQAALTAALFIEKNNKKKCAQRAQRHDWRTCPTDAGARHASGRRLPARVRRTMTITWVRTSSRWRLSGVSASMTA